MAYVKWFFVVAFWVIVAAFFHYTLPQVDIVRITDTYEKRENPGVNAIFWARGDAGSGATDNGRDVFFIQTRRVTNDGVMVYRNEDTGWGWPPYFKFDTANLQAEAADLRSTASAPQYAALRHYGWRIEFLSVYPNATSVWPVEGPDASKPLPWLNGVILLIVAAVWYGLWVRWRRFRESRIDPTLEDIQDSLEATGDAVAEKHGKLRRWWANRSNR